MHATETPSGSMSVQSQQAPPPRDTPATPSAGAGRSRRGLLIGAAAVLAIAAAVVIALLVVGKSGPDLKLGEPSVVSTSDLSTFAKDAKQPVYWAGAPAAGFKLELTEVKGERVFVRYIPTSAKAGDPRPAYTTIATYPMKGASDQLKEFATRPGAVEGEGAGGATTLYYRKAPSNVYVAPPNSDYLIEVFAPEPTAALQVAEADALVQVK